MVLGFTTDYATFAVPSASETGLPSAKEPSQLEGSGLMFFSTCGLEGAVGRMLSLFGIVTQELTDSWL